MEVISIPALIDGETFCEEIKTTEEYLAIKKVTDEIIWEAEFMQQPVESKGLLFPIEELNRFSMKEIATKKPDGIVGHTDTADKGSDFLSSPTAYKYGDYFYITDVVFTQDGVEITEPQVANMIIKHRMNMMYIESNNGGYQYTRNIRNLIKGKSFCTVIPKHTSQNKETRILMYAGYIKEYFYFRNDYEPGSPYDKFMRQLSSYVKLGKNSHDDAIDSITGLAENFQTKKFIKETKKEYDPVYGIPFDDEQQEFLYNFTGGKINPEMFKWN